MMRERTWTSRFADYYKLRPKFKSLSTLMVVSGGIAGFFVWLKYMQSLRTLLGIPLEPTSMDGLLPNFLTWIVGIIIGAVVILIPAIMLSFVVIGLLFAAFGAITFREAWLLGLMGQYPKAWFIRE